MQLEAAEAAAEAAQQQHWAAELWQEELETQNLRLQAELAKTQMIQSTLQDRGKKGLAQNKHMGDGGKFSLKCHWNRLPRFQFMRFTRLCEWMVARIPDRWPCLMICRRRDTS